MFNSHRMSAILLATTLAVAALFSHAPVAAQNAHGVIAFGEADQGSGVAYGFAWNFPAKDTAHAEAVNACISSGGTNCVQLAWFQNGCGALAIDQYGNAQGKPGMTREQAEVRALRTCEAAGGAGCNIVGSLCATPAGEPGTWSGSESVLPLQDAQMTVTGPSHESLTHEERVLLQQTLTALGFDAGPADGVFGQRTRTAIQEWQIASGHEATGYLTREQAASLTAVDASPDQEQELQQEAADNQSGEVLIFGPATGPKCSEDEFTEDGFCWREIANKSGCFLLELGYTPGSTSTWTWSGDCLNSAANGPGTFIYRYDDDGRPREMEGSGVVVQGFRQGHWIWHYESGGEAPDECGREGQYVDGKRSGRWITSCSRGLRLEFNCVDGQCEYVE